MDGGCKGQIKSQSRYRRCRGWREWQLLLNRSAQSGGLGMVLEKTPVVAGLQNNATSRDFQRAVGGTAPALRPNSCDCRYSGGRQEADEGDSEFETALEKNRRKMTDKGGYLHWVT